MPARADETVTQHWARSLATVVVLVAVLWAVELANYLTGYRLSYLGVFPRHVETLPGILLWPFLHVSAEHLLINTTPLLVLGYFVALRGVVVFLQTCLLIIVIGGTAIWLFGRPAYHIGASGLVFGFFGFLVTVGIYERSLSALVIGLFTLIYYGGMLLSIFPADRFISWEAHVFGLLGGIVAGRLLGVSPREREAAGQDERYNS